MLTNKNDAYVICPFFTIQHFILLSFDSQNFKQSLFTKVTHLHNPIAPDLNSAQIFREDSEQRGDEGGRDADLQ